MIKKLVKVCLCLSLVLLFDFSAHQVKAQGVQSTVTGELIAPSSSDHDSSDNDKSDTLPVTGESHQNLLVLSGVSIVLLISTILFLKRKVGGQDV